MVNDIFMLQLSYFVKRINFPMYLMEYFMFNRCLCVHLKYDFCCSVVANSSSIKMLLINSKPDQTKYMKTWQSFSTRRQDKKANTK